MRLNEWQTERSSVRRAFFQSSSARIKIDYYVKSQVNPWLNLPSLLAEILTVDTTVLED